MRLSRRGSAIRQSEIRAMAIACREAGGINLAQGVCDTETPDAVVAGAVEAVRTGRNSYTSHRGVAPLRHAIAQKELREKGVEIDPEREVVVASGATGAFLAAVLALLDPGDGAILFEPFYGYHRATLEAAGVEAAFVPLEDGFREFSDEALAAAVTPRTRAIVVNTPANPCGKVFTGTELRRIGEFAARHDLAIISDEIYEYFVYEGSHVSPLTLDEYRGRTVVVGGFSKTFSVTGWRIGYVVAPEAIATAIADVSDLVYVCPPAPLQYGVAQGLLDIPQERYRAMRDDHREKRDLLFDALQRVGLAPHLPDGAYYILADASHIPAETSRERALKILDQTGVAGVPGSAFFHDGRGDGLIRFCFARERSVIAESCKRLQKGDRFIF